MNALSPLLLLAHFKVIILHSSSNKRVTLPELPDVESFRKYFEKNGLNQPIRSIQIYSSKLVKNPKKVSSLKGKQFVSTDRVGKNLFINVSDGTTLVVHFGMTGFFHFFKSVNIHQKFTRYQINFEHKSLAYVDMRLLGFMELVTDQKSYLKKRDLGPDALEITFDQFKALSSRKINVKKALMDQSFIAGIGNVYADEILFQAKIHPLKKADDLTDDEIKRLFKIMKNVFKKAIALDAEPKKMPKTWLIPVRKKKAACPRCGSPLSIIKISTRGTYFCQKCQNNN